MLTGSRWPLRRSDRDILRALAERKRAMAADPIMEERRQLWLRHASLAGDRPMILAETQGVLDEVVPVSDLECKEDWARELERQLRALVFQHEVVRDDYVVEPWINCNWFVTLGNYGVAVDKLRGDNAGRMSSYIWDPPVRDLDRDLEQLSHRTPSVDRGRTLAWKELLEEIFDGILPVRIRGSFYWTMGLTWRAIELIGLEQLMLAMVDNPAGLHRLMAFLRDDHHALIDWLESEGLYSLNNENDYVGSGTVGYTAELPHEGFQSDGAVRARDLWVLSESQETVGVSPGMFEEFVLQYQLPLIERFGLCYYGCCEPVHLRWPILQHIPNLRRVSVSPWCDQAYMAQHLGRETIFCRKPHPGLVSTASWDEDAIREDLRQTATLAKDCNLEIVLKDVHTLANQPERLGRWVALAREACNANG